MSSHCWKITAEQMRELHIREAKLLGAAQQFRIKFRQLLPLQLNFHLINFTQLMQKPNIDLRKFENILNR